MKKGEMHVSFILSMLASNTDKDNVLHDSRFMLVVDEFNKLYRTKATAVTDEEVMEEMVNSKTYKFHRNSTSWWIETILSDERYEHREEDLQDDVYYLIIDTHTKKTVDVIACGLGPANLNGLRDGVSGSDPFWKAMAKIKLYNEEFAFYNSELINYILM